MTAFFHDIQEPGRHETTVLSLTGEGRMHATRLRPAVLVLQSPDRPRRFGLFLSGGRNACAKCTADALQRSRTTR